MPMNISGGQDQSKGAAATLALLVWELHLGAQVRSVPVASAHRMG